MLVASRMIPMEETYTKRKRIQIRRKLVQHNVMALGTWGSNMQTYAFVVTHMVTMAIQINVDKVENYVVMVLVTLTL